MSKLNIHRLRPGVGWEDWSFYRVIKWDPLFFGAKIKQRNGMVMFEGFKESKGPTWKPQWDVETFRKVRRFFLEGFLNCSIGWIFCSFFLEEWGLTRGHEITYFEGWGSNLKFPKVWWVNQLTIHYF